MAERLKEWVDEILTDDRTGVPPIAKLAVRPTSHFVMGHMPAVQAPRSGRRTRGFNLEFSFPPSTEPNEIDEVVRQVRAAIDADPTLDGRFGHGQVEVAEHRPVDQDKGTYGQGSALLSLRLRVTDFQAAE